MTSTCCTPPTHTPIQTPIVAPRRSAHPIWSLLHSMTRSFALVGQRRALGALEPHLLDDIGLSAEEARDEAGRPFWDAPAHWRSRR